MKKLFRSRPAQIGLGAFAVLNFAHAGVMAQDAARAYFANDPAGRDVVSILSQAPLETMLTRTGAIQAQIKINPQDVLNNPQARFQIDANTLDTGIALRNEHMKSAGWLDTAKYPTISFTLSKPLMRSEKKVVIAPGAKGEMPVEGELEFHGFKKTVRADVEVEVIPASVETKSRLEGDLMHIRAKFPLKLDEFGIAVPAAAQLKVANEQQVSVDVFVSTGTKAPDWAAPIAPNAQMSKINGKTNFGIKTHFGIGPTF
jgi:polyisoprenoid-binding protein YceI